MVLQRSIKSDGDDLVCKHGSVCTKKHKLGLNIRIQLTANFDRTPREPENASSTSAPAEMAAVVLVTRMNETRSSSAGCWSPEGATRAADFLVSSAGAEKATKTASEARTRISLENMLVDRSGADLLKSRLLLVIGLAGWGVSRFYARNGSDVGFRAG